MQESAPKKRPWTLMIYMAGDNGRVFETSAGRITLMAEMTSVGYRDLWEMGQIGTTDACAVICLFDTQQAAYLVEVRKGRGMADSRIERLREVNTGDPQTLTDFVVRSATMFPAERYGLILWNHGQGWLDLDPYASVRGQSGKSELFRRSVSSQTRPIAFDDSSKDFLDASELRDALERACEGIGRRIDVVGMDACLMAMIEGARELVQVTDTFVASQEVEPMAGWPYTALLQRVNAKPDMDGEGFAIAVVEEYAQAYGGRTRGDTITQSAISTARTEATERLCRRFVRAVIANRSPRLKVALQRARDLTLAFQERDYRDLGDFAAKVTVEAEQGNHDAVAEAARALRDHLCGRGDPHPVLRLGHSARYAEATGLSVYLPATLEAQTRETKMKPYRRLWFAQDAGWDFLIEWLCR
jgi:hypothetical protein